MLGGNKTFKEGDIRTYTNASDADLQKEAKRLHEEIDNPKLSAGEYVSTGLYNAIVIGATLAPLAFVGAGALIAKSPKFRKLTGIIGQEAFDEIHTLSGITSLEEKVQKAQEIIRQYTGKVFEPLEKVAESIEGKPFDEQQKIVDNTISKISPHFNKLTEKALKRTMWGTALGTFGGSSVIGTAVGVNKAKSEKAVENSTKLSHAERVSHERQVSAGFAENLAQERSSPVPDGASPRL